MAEVIRDINKYSNNLMTRQTLLTLGAERFTPPATVNNGGNVVVNNTAAVLNLGNVSQSGAGNVTISNNGAMTVGGQVANPVGNVLLFSSGAMTTQSGSMVSSSGNLGLFGGGLATNGAVSAGGFITLISGFRVHPAPCVLLSFWGYGEILGELGRERP